MNADFPKTKKMSAINNKKWFYHQSVKKNVFSANNLKNLLI